MANVAMQSDPLDEMRLVGSAVPDRLPAMLFLAAFIHGILIIGITFNPELTNPFADAISLEVTIVAAADQRIDRPDEATYLAQANQEGGGNTTEQVRLTAPLQSALPVENEGRDDGTALADAVAHEQRADELLATENLSDRQVDVDPRSDPDTESSIAIAMEAGQEATLPLPQEENATSLITDDEPRQLIVSADTRESAAAAYLDNWKRRVEAVGAEYLPQLSGVGRISGSPTLLVTISSDGALTTTVLSKSSGSTVLDLASKDIIQRAAPFDVFPDEMIDDFDSVAFEYKFLFAEQVIGGAP